MEAEEQQEEAGRPEGRRLGEPRLGGPGRRGRGRVPDASVGSDFGPHAQPPVCMSQHSPSGSGRSNLFKLRRSRRPQVPFGARRAAAGVGPRRAADAGGCADSVVLLAGLQRPGIGAVFPGTSSFNHFCSNLRQRALCIEGVQPPSTPLFPCELPFPEVLAEPQVPKSGRRVARFWARRNAMTFLNETFALHSFFELGCPRSGAVPTSVGPPRQHPQARAAACALLDEFMAFSRFGDCSPNGGRKKLLDLVIDVASRSSYWDAAGDSGGGPQAEWIDPNIMAIPTSGGTLDPQKFLTASQYEQYADPQCIPKSPTIYDDLPRPCHRVAPADEDVVMGRLLAADLAVIAPESILPKVRVRKHIVKGPSRYSKVTRSVLVGGLFGLTKPQKRKGDPKKQRIIFDRRVQNATEDRVSWIRLPAAAQLVHLVLGRRHVLRGSGKDLSDFYFYIRHLGIWWRRNAFGRRVSKALLDEWWDRRGVGPKKGPYRVCLKVAGMGDLNTVDLGTAVHEGILRNHGVLDEAQQLHYGDPLPPSDLLIGVYIDDLLILYVVVRSAARARGPDSALSVRASKAYVTEGVPEAERKAFDEKIDFESWGAEIRGGKGVIGAPLRTRRELWVLTATIIRFGYVSKFVLQVVLGLYASVLIHRREIFALFHHVFKFLEGLGEDWYRLPGFVADACRCVALAAVCWKYQSCRVGHHLCDGCDSL